MGKKILLSAKRQDDIIEGIVQNLNKGQGLEITFHDPTEEIFDLETLSDLFQDIDFFICKVSGDLSFDLLSYAKLNKIPTLHDLDTVLMCTNKVSLDITLRNVFTRKSDELQQFSLPKSWVCSVLTQNFKNWASKNLPIVLKSHYQHDDYMRFNFLMRDIKEFEYFCERYKNFLNYDVYIQKFIECDGIDRKIYVLGDQVYGIKRENPIYIFLRENLDNIDVSTIKRELFEPSEDMKKLARILSKELNLKIFGFDLIKPINEEGHYLIDLNDFPGFRGIENIEEEFFKFLSNYYG